MFIYLFIWLLWVLVATLGIFGDLWGSLGTFHCHAQILWLWQYLVQLLPSMWDLSSWTRNQTCVSCFARWTLNHWITREVPKNYIFKILKKKKRHYVSPGLGDNAHFALLQIFSEEEICL